MCLIYLYNINPFKHDTIQIIMPTYLGVRVCMICFFLVGSITFKEHSEPRETGPYSRCKKALSQWTTLATNFYGRKL